jgi:hypothetical protein
MTNGTTEKNLSQCHFVHNKSYTDWCEREPRPLRRETDAVIATVDVLVIMSVSVARIGKRSIIGKFKIAPRPYVSR